MELNPCPKCNSTNVTYTEQEPIDVRGVEVILTNVTCSDCGHVVNGEKLDGVETLSAVDVWNTP